jgi:hypothetical protein
MKHVYGQVHHDPRIRTILNMHKTVHYAVRYVGGLNPPFSMIETILSDMYDRSRYELT